MITTTRRPSKKPSRGGLPQQPPPEDRSVLVHDCFDQRSGETKPEDCGCERHISKLDAASLIRANKADALQIIRAGKPETTRKSIVLRREYVTERLLKSKINPNVLLPKVLKSASILSFKKNVLRGKNGTAFYLENRTDARYWNSVLIALGLGVDAEKFLKEAAAGQGLPASLTTLENFQMAPVGRHDGIDPEVDLAIALEIHEKKEGVQQSQRKVGGSGLVTGTSGGLTYGEFGKTKDLILPLVNEPDSWMLAWLNRRSDIQQPRKYWEWMQPDFKVKFSEAGVA